MHDTIQFIAQAGHTLAQPAVATPMKEPLLEYPDFTAEHARAMPWKYIGYRVFSKWMASDQAFCMVRRFGALNMRVMLALQDKLVELEDELRVIDEDESRLDMPDGMENGSFRWDTSDARKELLMGKILGKLKEYNKFVNQYSLLVSREPVRKDDIKEVQTWFENHRVKLPRNEFGCAIKEEETKFIYKTDDLIPVQPKVRSWFRNVLEKTALMRTPCLRSLLTREPQDIDAIENQIETDEDGKTFWHHEKRVERLSSWVIAIVGLAMLIGPLWILEYVDPLASRLGVISGFIVLFFFLVLVATTAQIFEVLAAAAAYSAVLMVFLQIGRGH